MYRILFLFIFLVPATCFSQKRIILTWDFFKNDRPANVEHQAVVSCGIKNAYRMRSGKRDLMEVEFDIKGGVDTATSYFNFDLKNKDLKLLNHEQGHADITVLYARQLTKKYRDTVFYKTTYSATIKRLYDDTVIQMRNKQLQYDEETNHGMNDSMQTKWDLFFKKELDIQ